VPSTTDRTVRLTMNRLKQGLMQAEERHGFEGDGFVYLRSPMWWAGIICCTGNPVVEWDQVC
jgi:hypothetical protein